MEPLLSVPKIYVALVRPFGKGYFGGSVTHYFGEALLWGESFWGSVTLGKRYFGERYVREALLWEALR